SRLVSSLSRTGTLTASTASTAHSQHSQHAPISSAPASRFSRALDLSRKLAQGPDLDHFVSNHQPQIEPDDASLADDEVTLLEKKPARLLTGAEVRRKKCVGG
ncbi:hypothetical protein HDU93_006816, partial [Gonapodya sp. JEL0774]